MPVPYSQNNLKGRFQTGDTPTQQDFADLIDTLFYLNQVALDTSAAAVASAAAALADSGRMMWSTQVSPGIVFTNDIEINIASIVHTGTAPNGVTGLYRVTFTTPFTNAFYVASLTSPITAGGANSTLLYIVAQNAAYIDVGVYNDSIPYRFALVLTGQLT